MQHVKDQSGHAALSQSDRPTKRRRLPPEDVGEQPTQQQQLTQTTRLPELAPEMWANVMDFLPYGSVLSSAVASRKMLDDVMPLVSTLHIDRARQLHSRITRRYRDVVDVYIYSLLGTVDVSSPLLANTVDSDTIERAVPFLSNFPKLERVFFGGFESIKGLCVGFLRNAYPEAEVEKVRFLINSLCGAFRSGSLSDKLSVLGLVAVGRGGEEMCQTSVNVVKSFPLATVVGCGHTFSTDCSEELTLRSINYHFADHRLYYLEVDMDMTDRRRFIMERPGGKEFLARYDDSHTTIYDAISQGLCRIVIVLDDGTELFVVKFVGRTWARGLQKLISEGNFDVSKLPSDKVTNAIKRAFAEDCRDPTPPRDRCYLAQSTFYALKEMGFRIDELDFLNRDEYDGTRMKTSLSLDRVRDYNCHYQWRFY